MYLDDDFKPRCDGGDDVLGRLFGEDYAAVAATVAGNIINNLVFKADTYSFTFAFNIIL